MAESTLASTPSPRGWPGLEAELADAAADVRGLAEGLDHDRHSLPTAEERLSRIYSLERRYGEGEAAVIAHGERAEAEIERLEGSRGRAPPPQGR